MFFVWLMGWWEGREVNGVACPHISERSRWFIGAVMWWPFSDTIGNNFVLPRQSLISHLNPLRLNFISHFTARDDSLRVHVCFLWRSPNDNLWTSWVVPFLPTKPLLRQLNGGNNEVSILYPSFQPLGLILGHRIQHFLGRASLKYSCEISCSTVWQRNECCKMCCLPSFLQVTCLACQSGESSFSKGAVKSSPVPHPPNLYLS